MAQRRGHPLYYELVERIQEIHSKKNSDYAKDSDPLSNFRRAEAFGVPAWKGALIRLSDKYSRIEELASGKAAQVSDESLDDTLMDLANYALLTIVLRREQKP